MTDTFGKSDEQYVYPLVWIEQYKVRIEYSTMIDTPVVDAAVHPVAVSLSGGDAKAHHQIWWYHHRFFVHLRKCLHSNILLYK